MHPFMKHRIFFLLIILLAAALRFWKLGIIPFGITHDEMGYIYNAYSIAVTGNNVFGETLPIFTWMNRGGFPFMPVPIYSMVPLFWIFPLIPFVGRLLPALLGTADIILIYGIAQLLFGSVPLSLLSALFMAISPWQIHFARSAYDANFALFWYLMSIMVLLRKKKNSKEIWIGLLAMMLAVFSYRGMSMMYLLIALALAWYERITSKQYWIGIGIISVLFLLPILLFGSSYTAEGTQLFYNPKMQQEIDTTIREAKGPLIIRRLFANKPTYIIDRFRENYLKAFSPEYLFLYTEPSAIYSIWSRGRLFFIDLFFIIPGFMFLYKRKRRAALFWFCLLLIGALPGGIGGLPYSSRNFLQSAIYPVLVAGGVMWFVSRIFHPIGRTIIVSMITLFYVYAVSSYLYDYYGRYAFYGAEGWAKSIKEISLLAQQKSSSHDMIFLGKTSFGDAVEFGFWNNINPVQIQSLWEHRKNQPFTFFQSDNIVFSEKCIDQKDLSDPMFQHVTTVYYITVHTCNNEATPSGKIEDYFGNPIWKLFEFDLQKPKSYSTL